MTAKPRDSSLRDAFVGILLTVGPFFGVRYRPPRVEIPVVTSPAGEPGDGAPAYSEPSDAPSRAPGDTGGDGIVI